MKEETRAELPEGRLRPWFPRGRVFSFPAFEGSAGFFALFSGLGPNELSLFLTLLVLYFTVFSLFLSPQMVVMLWKHSCVYG